MARSVPGGRSGCAAPARPAAQGAADGGPPDPPPDPAAAGALAAARRHIAAIGQAEALLPFETALLAMLLEQAKEIAVLRQELEQLKAKHSR